jgi:hypothetical protein
MLVPEAELKDPVLAVSGDKEGGIWFMDRTTPANPHHETGCDTTYSCTVANSKYCAVVAILQSISGAGPVVHTSPAFWESPSTPFLYIGSQQNTLTGSGELLQFTLSPTAIQPISSAGKPAYDPITGQPIVFPFGTTPAISANGTTASNGIVWAIWADGSVVPNKYSYTATHNGQQVTIPPAQNGGLYAFDALGDTTGLKKLYSSNDCTQNGNLVDQVNPATKFSVPTVANGYVYVGTQGAICDGSNNCYNNGTLYIFGMLPSKRTC